MPGQILNPTSTPSPRELAEREHQRHPSQHTPRRIAMLAQPVDVPLDLRAIHDARIRSTVCGLTKYFSNIGNFLSVDG